MRFGIPQHILPVDNDGNLNVTNFQKHVHEISIQEQTAQSHPTVKPTPKRKAPTGPATEELTTTTNIILETEIQPNDVLIGKGFKHEGNVRLSAEVETQRRAYNEGSKFEKTCIAMSFVESVKARKGRFLKRVTKGRVAWIEASNEEARKSVVNRFRNKVPIGFGDPSDM